MNFKKHWNIFINKEKKWLVNRMQQIYNWDKEFTKRALYEYIKFIKLKILLSDIKDEILAPSDVIDKIWIEHLNTQDKYIEFCYRNNKKNVLYRREINHDNNSIANYNEKYSTTLALLDEESFNKKDIWIYSNYVYRPYVQIFICSITEKITQISVNLEEPVFILKCRIRLHERETNSLQLYFNSTKLENKKSLSYYGITENSTILFVYNLI